MNPVSAADLGSRAAPIVPHSAGGPAPLSSAQRRLWMMHRLDPSSTASNRPVTLRLTGPLDPTALGAAVSEIVRRHEALRSVFREEGGLPVQLVEPPHPVMLPAVDLRKFPADAREMEARRLVTALAADPIDLASGPLLRGILLRLDEQEHVLALIVHHIAFDAWSEGVLVSELRALYEAFERGGGSPLHEPSLQYADYAAWQYEQISTGRLDAQLAYWTQHLAPLPPALGLPTDYPWPPVRTKQGHSIAMVLEGARAERLREWCRAHRLTPFMALLAAFEALLGLYSRQREFVIGVPVAGRNRGETESLIGCFMNIVPRRANLNGQPTFRDLALRVRETTLDSFAAQELPFERLVQELQPPRTLNRWPLFDALFNLRNVPRASSAQAGAVAITPFAVERCEIDGLAISLSVDVVGHGFHFAFRYATELFRKSSAEQLAAQYLALLETGVAEPECPVEHLRLATEADRRRMAMEWNRTRTEFPDRPLVHEWFEEQAARTPNAPAILTQTGVMPYRELDLRASGLASQLANLGIGPESIVGVYLERSAELIVALLAVLKAGAAYLPLEPTTPAERLGLMVGDANATVVLTQQALRADLPPTGARVLCIDGLDAPAVETGGFPRARPELDSLAYILFTSGSTGRPKAVMVSHRSLLNHLHWRCAAFGLGPADRVLHSAALGFDDAIWETFEPLVTGACIVLARPGRQYDPAHLVQLMDEQRVTVACFVPSLLAAVLEQDGITRCSDLTRVDTGGERLTADLQALFFERLPRATLFNGYGPAEATVASAFWPCAPDDGRAHPPIGRPIANTTIYVLDRSLQLVPPGVPGELYIGGAGVARGYLRRPGQTAAAFVPDPFGGIPGARLYRTGDIGRFRADGVLEFLGRTDFQLKVRGARVEPGEVETALERAGTVREAMVDLRRDPAGSERLVAWVAMRPDADLVPADLRGQLRTALPEHMVPTVFVSVDRLPRTTSGKIDRKALPDPDAAAWRGDTPDVPPSSETEARLAEIWAVLLNRRSVSARDDFFAAGGHSLLATQMVGRVEAAFGIELPLRAVFESPVLSALAERVDAAVTARPRHALNGGRLRSERLEPDEIVVPASFAQQRLWLLDQLQPGSPWYHIGTTLRVTGPLDPTALQQAVQALVDRHETLRTRIVAVDSVPMQVISPQAPTPVKLLDLSHLPPADRLPAARRLAAAAARRPFDLASGPLLRVSVVRLASDDHLLGIVLHHIISDGWSMGVFHRELALCYEAAVAGRSPDLAPLPIQYADYAAWQQDHLQGAVLERELTYWRDHLAGVPAAIELPTDRPRPPVAGTGGSTASIALPGSLTDALAALARQEGATLYMALLAGFASLLARWSGQNDIVIGSPLAGRLRPELEGLIGFFINPLALRVRVDAAPTFRTLLQQVRETALDAYAHQELPFERLVTALQPERTLRHHPVFQVMLQLLNMPHSRFRLPGLSVERLGGQGTTSKFDLSLAMGAGAEGLNGRCTYRTDLFDPATVEHLLLQYRALLEQCVAAPDAALGTHSLVTAKAPPLLPDPTTPLPAPPYPSVLASVAEQMQRAPAAVAVAQQGRTWSYGDLAATSERLAGTLASLGVVRGDVVALTGRPSYGLVAAMLGVMRSGGVMLLVDRNLPLLRRQLMVTQGRAKWLVAVDCEHSAEWSEPRTLLAIDGVSGAPPRGLGVPNHGAPLSPPPALSDPAYIFFTSGTTGVPKAILGTHAGLAHFLAWQRATFPVGPGERSGQLTNLSFDVVLRDVFLPLTSGARLCLPPGDLTPDRTLDWLRGERISVLHAVPSIVSAWLQQAGNVTLSDLRWAFFAGEPLSSALVRRVREIAPQALIVNLYGPTEATLAKCCHVVGDEPAAGIQPVGRSLPDTQVLVLSPEGRLCGVNEPGEIVIRTPFLTRGYINLTGGSQGGGFMPNPFRSDPDDRVYRTGDRGRVSADGNLHVLGRMDHQVKVRGVRVEPDEVTAVLAQHPEVLTSCVVARLGDDGEMSLVAYVVGRSAPDPSRLRAFLAQRLPGALVPSAFVQLPALPLLPNGKVDRQALPAPQPSHSAADASELATAIQKELAGIWREILKLEHVGPYDDFFDLGGHSLLATQLVARVHRALAVQLPLSAVFETPQLGQLAARIEAAQSNGRAAPALARVSREAYRIRVPDA